MDETVFDVFLREDIPRELARTNAYINDENTMHPSQIIESVCVGIPRLDTLDVVIDDGLVYGTPPTSSFSNRSLVSRTDYPKNLILRCSIYYPHNATGVIAMATSQCAPGGSVYIDVGGRWTEKNFGDFPFDTKYPVRCTASTLTLHVDIVLLAAGDYHISDYRRDSTSLTFGHLRRAFENVDISSVKKMHIIVDGIGNDLLRVQSAEEVLINNLRYMLRQRSVGTEGIDITYTIGGDLKTYQT
jgi:hypothetical protein